MSGLAWARQPPGAPGHRALARLVEQRGLLSTIGLDPACAEGVHPERLRKLAREGARFTAQHLRALSPLRRRATLVATVLDTITRLTDDTVALFDRAVGRMFRRAEIREQDALMRDARAINDKVRLLAKLGAALIEARENGADLQEAVAAAIGWDKLAHSVDEAKRLARPDKADLPALAARAWPVLHRLGPLFLGSLRFHAVPAAAATLRAVELLRSIYESGGRKWPHSLPTSFLRPAWREAVLSADGAEAPDLGGGHPAGVARPAARRRHLGRGQPAMARRRGPADRARAVRRDARGRPAPRRGAGDRRGIPRRASRSVGAAPLRSGCQGRGRPAGRRADQGRRAEDHAAQGGRRPRRPKPLPTGCTP